MQPVIRMRNGTIYVDNTPLQEEALQKSYLTVGADAAAGDITVKNGNGFDSIGGEEPAEVYALLIEDIGNERAEIRLFTDADIEVTADGTLIAFSSDGEMEVPGTLSFAHAAGTPVYLIKYNQIQISFDDVDSAHAT